MADCYEFVVQADLDKWGDIDVELQVDDAWDFT